MSPQMKQTAILVYEVGQLDALIRFLASLSEEGKGGVVIVAIGADIEFALEKQGRTFISGKGLRTMRNAELILYVEKLGREVLDDPTFSFFSYRGVRLGDIYMPALQNYLLYVLYFVDVITTLVQKHSEYKKFVLFSPATITYETAGVFALLEGYAAVEAARFVGKTFGFEVVVLESSVSAASFRSRMKRRFFDLQRFVFGYILAVLNAATTLLVRPKKMRILASDYWKNMSPLMAELPESELLQLDRGESRKTSLVEIFKHRMRFVHIEDYLSRSSRKNASDQKEIFSQKWVQIQDKNMPLLQAEFRNQVLAPILVPALKRMVLKGGVQAVNVIEGTYSLYEKMKPDIVWVRASVSAQIHFPILCYVAKMCGIPSIEVQHGILYLGPGSFINRPAVEYIATYGPLATEQLKKFGYTDAALPTIGSPRFDVYQELQGKVIGPVDTKKPFMITCIAPAVLPHSWSDTYQIVDYFQHIAEASSAVPNAHVTIKLRPGGADADFFREAIARAFTSVPYTIAQREPLVEVLRESDAVIAIYSTTVLEGLISGKPVIYDGYMGMHHMLGEELTPYETAGALVRVHTTGDCAKALQRLAKDPKVGEGQVQKAKEFMDKNYAFDGGASGRLAVFLKKLATREEVV